MIASHIHDALGQVRQLRVLLLENRKFTGFSGTARMMGGTVALLGGVWMHYFATSYYDLLGAWGSILIIALLFNLGALMLWFFQQPKTEKQLQTIAPAFEILPPLFVGAAVSVALIVYDMPDLLFGSWMCLYGLAHTHSRTLLPKENNWLGYYYILSGVFFLLSPSIYFFYPLPAILIFTGGEWIGGIIFYRHRIKLQKESYE